MQDTPAHFPAWPGDAEVAVALTFAVDGEAPWLSEGPEYARRLTMLSQGRFGPGRGMARILAGGHEVGHHGYLHRGTDGLDAAAQRAELEEGLTALGKRGVLIWCACCTA